MSRITESLFALVYPIAILPLCQEAICAISERAAESHAVDSAVGFAAGRREVVLLTRLLLHRRASARNQVDDPALLRALLRKGRHEMSWTGISDEGQ